MKKSIFLKILCLLPTLPFAVHGSALVTTSHQVEVGEIRETSTGLSVPNPYGAVEYKKEQILWFSTSPEIDTLYKAGQKAQSDGNVEAAKALYEQSVGKEPATANEAQTALNSLSSTPGATGNGAPDARKIAEQKIAQGKQMIEDGQKLNSASHLSTGTLGAGGAKPGDNKTNSDALQRISDGQKLVDEGQKELQAINNLEAAQKEAEEKKIALAEQKKQETQQVIDEVKQAWDSSGGLANRTQEEIWVNRGVGAAFALLILMVLWQITMLEPKKS